MPDAGSYPASASDRDRFVLARRGARPALDPWRHQGILVEDEPSLAGGLTRVATVFITGRECPWRCAMCDLWQHTLETDTPDGAVPAQIAAARAELEARDARVTALKLYNAGSFFDPRAVPERDYAAVAAGLAGLSRVIVESHPALIGPRVDRFVSALAQSAAPQLEVAMGLETAHPEALDRLNKRFTTAGFGRAARALSERGVALRVFLLIDPPFVAAHEQDDWLLRSLDAAFDCGAEVVSLIPTRAGNGTMEALQAGGLFVPPGLERIERVMVLALSHAAGRGVVFADTWDLDRFAPSGRGVDELRARLHTMNLRQLVPA